MQFGIEMVSDNHFSIDEFSYLHVAKHFPLCQPWSCARIVCREPSTTGARPG